jgi:hypothetical protein
MNSLDKIKQRTFQYYYQDGITDLGFGSASLILSLYFYLQTIVPENTPIRAILDASLILVVIGSVYLIRKVIETLKIKLVYPRSGYILYQRKPKRRLWIAGITGAVVSSLISVFIISAPEALNWMPFITGIVISVVLLIISIRLGLIRYSLLAIFSACEGGLLSTLGIGDILGLSLFYAAFGLVLFVLGGWLLVTYLRRYPISQSDEPESGSEG